MAYGICPVSNGYSDRCCQICPKSDSFATFKSRDHSSQFPDGQKGKARPGGSQSRWPSGDHADLLPADHCNRLSCRPAYLLFGSALRGSVQTSSIVLPKSAADTSRYLWLEAGTRFPHRVLAIRTANVLALPPEMTTVSTLKGGASRCIVSLIIYFNFSNH